VIDSKGDRDESASDEIERDEDGKESVCSGVLDIDEKRGKSAKFIGLEPPKGVGRPREAPTYVYPAKFPILALKSAII
jgi:hypothetical protein